MSQQREPSMYDEFSKQEAADYCGIKLTTVNYHLHRSKLLIPDKHRGQMPIFYRATLDTFKSLALRPWRKKQS